MKKGIVMDMNERFLTLLTPDGEFLQVPKQSHPCEIGQEILIPVQEKQSMSVFNLFSSFKGKSVAALAIACIFAIISFIPYNSNEVYAYMSIDVNPSIELGVNDDLQVIEIIPYNERGKEILNELDSWEKQDIKSVTSLIIERLKDRGYLKGEQELVISTVHTGEAINKSEQKLDEAIDEIKISIAKEQTEVIEIEATTEERNLALESGVTAGKLISEQKKSKKSDDKSKNKKEKTNQNSSTVPKKQDNNGNKEQNSVKNNTPNNHNGVGQFKKNEQAEKEQERNKNNKDKNSPGKDGKSQKDPNKHPNNNKYKNNNQNDHKNKNKQPYKNNEKPDNRQKSEGNGKNPKQDNSKGNNN